MNKIKKEKIVKFYDYTLISVLVMFVAWSLLGFWGLFIAALIYTLLLIFGIIVASIGMGAMLEKKFGKHDPVFDDYVEIKKIKDDDSRNNSNEDHIAF